MSVGSQRVRGRCEKLQNAEISNIARHAGLGFPENLYSQTSFEKSLLLTLYLITFLILKHRRFLEQSSLTRIHKRKCQKGLFPKIRSQTEKGNINISG